MMSESGKYFAERVIGVRGKKILKFARLRARQFFGYEPFTGLNGLDRRLLSHMPATGFFVEAGANDGIDQSNTYYLESRCGWSGILVEPFGPLAELARRFR